MLFSLLLQVQALNTVDLARDGAVQSRPKMCWGASAASTCNISIQGIAQKLTMHWQKIVLHSVYDFLFASIETFETLGS